MIWRWVGGSRSFAVSDWEWGVVVPDGGWRMANGLYLQDSI